MHGIPVRVTRGPKHKSKYSPSNGYKYGGLYQLTEHFYEIGKDGFGICRFKLEKLSAIIPVFLEVNEPVDKQTSGETSRVPTTILRIVRDTKLSRKVKEMYNYTCQICGLRIEFNGVGYAEAAHIKPLGKPHNGKDLLENLLCLCPNHHVMFDKGHFTINNDLTFSGIIGSLKMMQKHVLDADNLKYHREHHK
ncbi:YDG/SRA domain protein [compost metagenome]